jgi:phosphatidylserine/phosphatidylglycerophosphate/cardiolipin synthase-like enzyme
MNTTRAFVLALACLASAAGAQTVTADFDGVAARPAEFFAALPRPARPPRAPRRAPGAAPGPATTVSFHGASLPARAFSRTDRIPGSLVAAIDATRSTLRLALYQLTLPGVADAIVRAKGRGVDVKLIYDQGHGGAAAAPGDGSQPASASGASPQFNQVTAAGVETRLLKGGGSFGIMHNKFAVFDGELVETGSFNWTTAADGSNFENALFRDDASLASLYASYFDWMWALGRPVNPSVARDLSGAFGTPPADPSPSVRFKGGAWPRVMFSPGGGTEARLVAAVNGCGTTLEIAMFSFYSMPLADAVIAAKSRGVAVRVVTDVSQARRSPAVAKLAAAGVDLRLSAGRDGRGVLHHKFARFDGEMLTAGSFNFSENAESNNFENQIFSADPGDLIGFGTEFEAVWAQGHAPAPGEIQGASVAVASAAR